MKIPGKFFGYQKGILHVEKISIPSLARRYGTPLYVYSEKAFLNPLEELQEGLKKLKHKICFAVKANSNLSVLRLLKRANAGMDVVTGGELFRVEKAGVRGEDVIFSGVGKTPEEMLQGLHYMDTGIFSFNVESIAELKTLNAVSHSQNKTAPVSLRFNPNIDAKSHPYISTGLKKNKFGLDEKEIRSILKNSALLKNIRIMGLSIHIGSQITDLSVFNEAFAKVKKLALDFPHLQMIDLGGGLGIQYSKEKVSISKYCALIQKHFGQLGVPIHIEPGRTIAGNAGLLVVQVLYRKPRKSKDFLIVDGAMTDLLRPALYGSHHEIIPLDLTKAKGKTKKTDVVGPVCESSDFLAQEKLLSEKIEGKDYLAVLSAGAYGFTMASQYNSRPRAAEVLVSENKSKLIRKRESYEDLVRGE